MNSTTQERESLTFHLGSFEGFNHRDQDAIAFDLSAQEVLDWDHEMAGEAEFWPAGDHDGVSLVFQGSESVTPFELAALDKLLDDIGNDSIETFVRIHVLIHIYGNSLWNIVPDSVEQLDAHIFTGETFIDLRDAAAYELFELYYPEEYAVWQKSLCDGLIFDTDRFLDSPLWCTEEIHIADTKILVVLAQ